MFCSNCGKQISDSAKFCRYCGASTISDDINTENNKTNTSNGNYTNNDNSQRKTIYEGALHKCPNCGESLGAFDTVCPSCGYEIRDRKATSSIKELSRQLQAIEAKRMPPLNYDSILTKRTTESKSLFHSNTVEENIIDEKARKKFEKSEREKFEAQKLRERRSAIKNFVIPNSKEDIVEFFDMACSNIDGKDSDDDVWDTKRLEAYNKAKVLFPNSNEFKRMESIMEYNSQSKVKINNTVHNFIHGDWSKKKIIWTIVIVLIFLSLLQSCAQKLFGLDNDDYSTGSGTADNSSFISYNIDI